MHGSKRTSTTAHAWDYHPADSPQRLYRTSWQPVIQAIMQDQPIAIDIAPLIRACSPADSMGLYVE